MALEQAEIRAAAAEARADALEGEVARGAHLRKWVILAVVTIAAVALVVLGSVAFNAVDDEGFGPRRSPYVESDG